MKLFLSYKKYNLIIILLVFVFNSNISYANEAIEKSLKELTQKLRCMTCQNQSIYDSDADFSKDIKKIIRKKLVAGKSKKEISDFLVKRYGEYILFEPQFNKKNFLLWIFPFSILFVSAIFLLIRMGRNDLK